ncbi:P-loop ATPase, Sll1717 family [Enterococcus pernyi]
MKIKDIYFGDVEGKDEAYEAKERNSFENIFYRGFRSYEDMLLPSKFLVIGRKGTGKTLLAEYFKNEQEKVFNLVKILDESEFALKKLEKFNYKEISEQEMIIFWEYFFLSEIANFQFEKLNKWYYLIFPCVRKLKEMIRNKPFDLKRFRTEDKDTLATSINAVMGIQSSVGGDTESTTERLISKDFEEKEYYKEIKNYLNSVKKCSKLLKNKKMYLIFDDLDELEIFAGTNEAKITFIHSMVKTVKRMNAEFRDKKIEIKIFLLMRQDMADDLNKKTNNFSKTVNSNSIQLNWEYDSKIGLLKQPLTQMIIKKVKQSSKDFCNAKDTDIYYSTFPGKVSRKTFIKYLIDHSFGRPRDFVMLLNTIKEKYGEFEKIKPSHVTNSIPDYSIKFYKELENEINRSPNKPLLVDGILLLKDNQLITFTLEDLISTYEKNPNRYPGITNASMIEHSMKELYRYNVLGTSSNVTNENNEEVSVVEFYYRNNAISNPDLSNYMSVHFALRSALNVIAKKKTS